MIVHLRPTSSGWAVVRAVVFLGVVALALAGCGRKGALDLPPNASGPNGPVAAAPVDNAAEAMNKPNLFNANPDVDAPPAAPKGRKKPFVLDPLLDR